MSDFLQLGFQGLALGAIYALIALGFVIVYKATDVINFSHGELMLLGAYLVYSFHNEAGLSFFIAVPMALAAMAAVGWLIERAILRRMVGEPVFAVVMITIGLAIVVRQIVTANWGYEEHILGDPWGATQVDVGSLRINMVSIVTILVAAAVLGLFFLFFRYTRYGVAMRAAAFDQEAALAVGIPVRRVHAVSWMIAAAIATIAGVFIASFPSTLTPALGFAALRAFPAAILGGLDSPGGAVLGGFIIGEVELLSQGYGPQYASFLGNNFHVVAAYLIMILVLMVRPYGLFGTREVERV
jgi:branched-chain amino acid transport system permease protein